jgi:hypothetical protein
MGGTGVKHPVDVAVFCVTRHEACAARGVLRGAPEPVVCGGRSAVIARLGTLETLVVSSGFKGDIEPVLADIAEHFPPRLLINFGAAGAIADDLPIGAPTVPREIIAYDWPDLEQRGGAIRCAVQRIESRLPGIRFTARAGSCAHTICDAAIRARLRESLRIDTTDWETYPLGLLAQRRGWDFLALRCVSDLANDASETDYRASVQSILDDGAKQLAPLAEAWE